MNCGALRMRGGTVTSVGSGIGCCGLDAELVRRKCR